MANKARKKRLRAAAKAGNRDRVAPRPGTAKDIRSKRDSMRPDATAPVTVADLDDAIVESPSALLRSPVVRAARELAQAWEGGHIDCAGLRIPVNGNPDGRDMTSMTVLLTPNHAVPLQGRYAGGRGLSSNHVVKLSKTIADGQWALTHQTIAVDIHGNVYDGQHRCGAVVKSGLPILISIMYNCPPQGVTYTDLGRGRTTGDMLALSPCGFSHHAAVATAVSQAMMGMSFADYARIPKPEIVRVAEMYHEQIKWMFKHMCPGKGIKNTMYAPILRAIIDAWDDEARLERIREFCAHMKPRTHTGPAGCPLNKLGQFLNKPGGVRREGFKNDRVENYIRIMVALDHFIAGKSLNQWRFPKEDTFALDTGQSEIDEESLELA